MITSRIARTMLRRIMRRSDQFVLAMSDSSLTRNNIKRSCVARQELHKNKCGASYASRCEIFNILQDVFDAKYILYTYIIL